MHSSRTIEYDVTYALESAEIEHLDAIERAILQYPGIEITPSTY